MKNNFKNNVTLFFAGGALFNAAGKTSKETMRTKTAKSSTFLQKINYGCADSDGVKIQYAVAGKGPLLIMIPSFLDFGSTWRKQMKILAANYQVVAIDQRGYNKNLHGKVSEYDSLKKRVEAVAAVIHHFCKEKAIIVGHDWGGAVAWQFALNLPQMTDKLIILNTTHPNEITQKLAINLEQQESSSDDKASVKSTPNNPAILFGKSASTATRSNRVTDKESFNNYIAACKKSDFTAMLNYYEANYARPSSEKEWEDAQKNPLLKLKMPVLVFHHLDDWAIDTRGVRNTWEYLKKDMTLVTVPGANHFMQHDASKLVPTRMKSWLASRVPQVA